MFKKVEEYLKKKQEALKQQEQMKKAQAYYRLIKAGNTFIQFVQEDMKKNQDNVNRAMRRRMQAELNEKGVLSEELVQYYAQKIDWVLMNIHQRLNPSKPTTLECKGKHGAQKGKCLICGDEKNGVQVRTTPPNGYQPKPSTETGKIIPPQGGTGETKSAS